mgnify:FL=1
MSCSQCTSSNGTPRGCKSNGTCGTDSCNKLTVFDWLANMQLPSGHTPQPYVEVQFKNSRKQFCRYEEGLSPSVGNMVITEEDHGYDVGIVTLAGPLVALQMKRKKKLANPDSIGTILRLANDQELEIWETARKREAAVQKQAREIALRLGLEMKLSDVEFQGDGKKATFYYTAEKRVDFRQLIKDFAQAFSIRIEMRQVGLREEASRLGGIGSCGRELCCSTWLTDFRSVSTGAARYQQLSLNPTKLAGQCGKLKCCLNYELDVYRKSLKKFPRTETKLHTQKGVAVFQKMDIFKELLWYSYKDDWMTWHKLGLEDVLEIIEKNKAKITVTSLEDFQRESYEETDKALFENTVGQDSLTRFDSSKKQNKRRSKRRYNNRRKRKKNV